MKIISGIYKGRNILGYDISGTRPTQDRVKENLFNIINFDLPDKVVLDLFSGSGNLGIEALSRGAKYSYLVDNNPKAIDIIKKNINNLDISNAQVIKKDYKQALKYLKDNDIKLDIIFLDPPYKTNYIEESIKLIDEYNLLSKDGLIICESNDLDKIIYPDVYTCKVDKKYSDKHIQILKVL
ncbi:MAG: 16S rRNA (guanine(966)-N(2))-methyltransferase RsmD [Bacilli bacterium]|nr:16S rRNA (guanine(966)-N(2))-methyltransferase RsmD [Bacilli bacterium]